MAIRKLTCIICPRGCGITIELDNDGKVLGISGNACNRGAVYAETECTNPMRTVTSTMRCSDGSVLPVKTASPIPKSAIADCMKIINSNVIPLPVNSGDVVISNVFGSDIVATENRISDIN